MDLPFDAETLADLVRRAKDGDGEAFTELYRAYLTPIFRFVRLSVRDEDDAEDITQQVFVKVWSALPRYADEGKPFSAWLYRIARNAVIDRARKAKAVSLEDLPEPSHPEGGEEADPSHVAFVHMGLDAVSAMLGDLTAEQRDVIILRFVEARSNKEVAAIMGKSEVSVRQLQCRALKAMRAHPLYRKHR